MITSCEAWDGQVDESACVLPPSGLKKLRLENKTREV